MLPSLYYCIIVLSEVYFVTVKPIVVIAYYNESTCDSYYVMVGSYEVLMLHLSLWEPLSDGIPSVCVQKFY